MSDPDRPRPPPPLRTKWTRRVPHPVLIGHAASLTPYASERGPWHVDDERRRAQRPAPGRDLEREAREVGAKACHARREPFEPFACADGTARQCPFFRKVAAGASHCPLFRKVAASAFAGAAGSCCGCCRCRCGLSAARGAPPGRGPPAFGGDRERRGAAHQKTLALAAAGACRLVAPVNFGRRAGQGRDRPGSSAPRP